MNEVTCIKEYKLVDDGDKTLWTFNIGGKFNKIDYDRNIIYTEGFIRIDVGHLKISYGKNLPMYYLVVIVPESHFLTTEELRNYNINRIL